jgi:hypothetical protein
VNQIPLTEEWVALLSLAGAVASVALNWQAARVGLTRFRTVHAGIATISVLYVAGYLWLLFGNVDPARWSSTLRGLSLVAWVVVWALPAALSVRMNRELHQAIRKRFDETEPDA